MNRSARGILVLTLALAAISACEVVDQVRDRGSSDDGGSSASSGGLTLALQTPGLLRAGSEGTIRLSLTNHGDSVPRNVRLDLIVPGWMELAPPRPGEREVTMGAQEGEGTRFSYRLDEPAIGPGETQILEQRVRVPLESAPAAAASVARRLIRARLVNAQGQTLTEVQSELTLDSAFIGASRAAAEASAVPRDRLGPARLGMPVAELRQAASGARDTSWSQEGSTEQGVVFPVQGGQALAMLSGDTVIRIVVSDRGPRTQEALGVGSTMEELRESYGRACAAAGEGIVAVWFPAAPGISFALDAPFASVQQFQQDPSRIPGTARVTRWWLRRGTDNCPATGG